MVKSPAHLLALFSASLTMLLNVSLPSATEFVDQPSSIHASSESTDHETAGESNSERFEEEREEESETKIHLFCRCLAGKHSLGPCCGLVGVHGFSSNAADRLATLSIRGPPAT